MQCPYCKNIKMAKAGWGWSGRKQVQRYKCKQCGYVYADPKAIRIQINIQEKGK